MDFDVSVGTGLMSLTRTPGAIIFLLSISSPSLSAALLDERTIVGIINSGVIKYE